MDRLAELTDTLATTLNDLREEAARRDLRGCGAPLAWLDEANAWLRYELARAYSPDREPVPFTYIPAALRK